MSIFMKGLYSRNIMELNSGASHIVLYHHSQHLKQMCDCGDPWFQTDPCFYVPTSVDIAEVKLEPPQKYLYEFRGDTALRVRLYGE